MLLLLVIIACTPYQGFEDRWTEAYALCEPPEPFVRQWESPPLLPEDCEARLVEDFGIVDQYRTPEVREWLIEAAYNLLGRDMGRVSELESTEYVREPFIERTREQAERLDTDDVRATLYSFAAFEINAITDTDADLSGFRYIAETRTMYVKMDELVSAQPELIPGAAWAVSVVHEATHGVVAPHVRCATNPDLNCDPDWSGAYGAQFATAELMLLRCEWETDARHCLDLEWERSNERWRVEAD